MIAVIQCASSKQPHAGYFRTEQGKPVYFVADPGQAPVSGDRIYARPDEFSEDGTPWRERLLRYNASPGGNPFGLLPAFELYAKDTYRRLVQKFGTANTFILSAGWGLISSTFLTPAYDITFSPGADAYKRRRKTDVYNDFCMIPVECDDPIFFFGGKDYLPLFARLTRPVKAQKTVFFNSVSCPDIPGFSFQRFNTSTRTNWHYECANAFIAGTI